MGLLQHLRPASPAAIFAAGFFCITSPTTALADEEGADAIEIDLEAAEIIEIVGGVEVAVEPDAAADTPDADAPPPEPLSPGGKILAALDFDPNAANYAERASALFLEPEALADVRQKIIDLDAEDFRARNEASKRLAMVEAPVEHLLGVAREGAGIEMSRRIQSILNVRIKQRRLDALYHVAERIAETEEPGFVGRLLTIASTFDPDHHWELMRMFEYAVARSARDQDKATLEAALAGEDLVPRELAAFALGFHSGTKSNEGAKDDSLSRIAPDDDTARLAALRGQVASGQGDTGEGLVALLRSDDLRVRHEAGMLLRAVHGKDFGFAGYDAADIREAAVGKWSNFLSNASSAPQPVRLGAAARGAFQVLIGKKPGKTGAVLNFTTSGSNDGDHPLAAAMGGIDPNAISFDDTTGLIVASGGKDDNGRITVFSSEGVELWNISGFPAQSGCAPVPGGKLLVAIGSEVEELDVTGDRTGVWNLGAGIASFARLREGRFLCTHPEKGSVAEYDRHGRELWSREGFNRPRKVSRLPNGHLLIVVDKGDPPTDEERAEGGNGPAAPLLIETSPDGAQVLATIAPKGIRQITSAARLPNGNTLVGTEKGLAEYTPEGYAVKVWLKTAISSLHVR